MYAAKTNTFFTIRGIMNIRTLALFIITSIALQSNVAAYQVWTSGTKMPRAVVTSPEVSENTLKLVEGLNLNFAALDPDDGPFAEGELPMRAEDWEKYFAALKPSARNGFQPFSRTGVYHPVLRINRPTLEEKFNDFFKPNNLGYAIGTLMPYGNDYDGVVYNYTKEEIQWMRTWLDTTDGGKYKFVRLARNVRNFAGTERKQDIADGIAASLYQTHVFEARPDHFYDDVGSRQAMLDYFFKSTDPKVLKQQLIFQIPLFTYGPWEIPAEPGADAYQMVRNFVVWITEKWGCEVLRGDRVVFQITNYSNNVPFYPELDPKNNKKYYNSALGVTLSLLEQEDLFTGMLKNNDGSQRKPTKADAYSYVRTVGSTNTAVSPGANPPPDPVIPDPTDPNNPGTPDPGNPGNPGTPGNPGNQATTDGNGQGNLRDVGCQTGTGAASPLPLTLGFLALWSLRRRARRRSTDA